MRPTGSRLSLVQFADLKARLVGTTQETRNDAPA